MGIMLLPWYIRMHATAGAQEIGHGWSCLAPKKFLKYFWAPLWLFLNFSPQDSLASCSVFPQNYASSYYVYNSMTLVRLTFDLILKGRISSVFQEK